MDVYDFDEYEIGTKQYGGSDKKFLIEIDGTYYMIKQPSELKIFMIFK